jgi:hypothetical protein
MILLLTEIDAKSNFLHRPKAIQKDLLEFIENDNASQLEAHLPTMFCKPTKDGDKMKISSAYRKIPTKLLFIWQPISRVRSSIIITFIKKLNNAGENRLP